MNPKILFYILMLYFLLACSRSSDHISVTEPNPNSSRSDSNNAIRPTTQLTTELLIEVLSSNPCAGTSQKEWHITYVGADLAKEFIAVKSKGTRIDVGLIDVIFHEKVKSYSKDQLNDHIKSEFSSVPMIGADGVPSWHGTEVANLIFHERQGSSQFGNLNAIGLISFLSYDRWSKVKIINRSGGFLPKDDEKLLSFLDRGGIYVQASGNGYPKTGEYYNIDGASIQLGRLEKLRRIIQVGAYESSGLISKFSDESDSVTTVAPGTDVLVERPDGSTEALSGTSFAAPIATGALINALSLNPELNIEDLKRLLHKSNLKSLYHVSTDRTQNGSGFLNAYGLVRLVDSPGLDLAGESQKNFENAHNFPVKPNCDDYKKAFNELRKAFFLHPIRRHADVIGNIYGRSGNFPAKFFYGNLGLSRNEAIAKIKSFLDGDFFEYREEGQTHLILPKEQVLNFISRYPKDSEVFLAAKQKLKSRIGDLKSPTYPWEIDLLGGDAYELLPDVFFSLIEDSKYLVFDRIQSSLPNKKRLEAPPTVKGQTLMNAVRRLIRDPRLDAASKSKLEVICEEYQKSNPAKILEIFGDCY